jgi:hypothetical protein
VGAVRVSPAGEDTLQARPRTVVTGAFILENTTSQAMKIDSRLDLPQDWQLVISDIPQQLLPQERNIGLVSLMVPRTAAAGSYRIGHRITVRGDPSIRDSTAIEVVVLALAELDMEILNAQEYVVAGDDYEATFALVNRGNTAFDVSLRAHTNAGLAYALQPERLHILPAESRTITVTLKTESDLRRTLRDRLALVAVTSGAVRARARAVQPLEVIPRITGVEDRFHRIPVQVAIRNMWEENGTRVSRFQAEFRGEGTFDEQETRHVAFAVRGPDSKQNRLLGRRDEYSFSHWTETYEIGVGDHGYSISPLLESYRYGRGVKGKLALGRVTLGGYHLETRDEEPLQRQSAGYIGYAIVRRADVRLNYLAKENGYRSDMAGLEVELRPTESSNLELEYARGLPDAGDNNAFRMKFRVLTDRVSFFHRFMHADPDYHGYVSDMNFIASSLGFDLGGGFRLDGSFRGERRNLDLDPLRLSAPTDQSYDFRLDYRLETFADFSVAFRKRNYEDPLLDPQVNLSEDGVRFAMGRRFQSWGIHVSVEPGRSKNRLNGSTSRFQRYAGSVRIQPSPRQTIQCYVHYDNAFRPGEIDRRNLTAGLNASVKVAASTRFDLGIRLDDPRYPFEQERDIFELGFSHRISARSSFRAHGQYTWNRDLEDSEDQMAFTVELRTGLGMPASRKQGIGLLKGRIYDEITGKPVEDAIIRLAGITAVTDRKGKFVFPSVTAGTHHLDVDRASIGIERITRRRTPAEVYVEGGKTVSIEIGVVPAAAIGGRVVLYSYDDRRTVALPEGCRGDLEPDRGLPSMLVEITDGVESRRVLTDPDGSFRFNEVRPGPWMLMVHDTNLPEHTYVEQGTYEFKLMPGEEERLELRVLPRLRPIEILEEGGTLRETPRPQR